MTTPNLIVSVTPLRILNSADNLDHLARHLPPLPEDAAYRYHLPRPIILDSNLRLASDCKLLKNHREGRGRRPWVVGSRPESTAETQSWAERKLALEAAGARIVEVPGKDGKLFLT